MLRTALTAMILLAAAVPAVAVDYYTVRNNGGGELLEFLDKAREIKAQGKVVKIDGKCASACLLLLHTEIGNQYCATPSAKLGFHMPIAIDNATGRPVMTPEWLDQSNKIGAEIFRTLPVSLQAVAPLEQWPSVHAGAKSSDMLWVTGDAAVAALGPCP